MDGKDENECNESAVGLYKMTMVPPRANSVLSCNVCVMAVRSALRRTTILCRASVTQQCRFLRWYRLAQGTLSMLAVSCRVCSADSCIES
jgi:hypothetical protein